MRLLPLAVASCFGAAVHGAGVDPNVVAGSATFNQVGKVMTVVNSNGTIINWGALSVLQGETLIFDQAATSSVLNRVVGIMMNGKLVIDPTIIAGTIKSPGTVIIVNSSGTMITPTAKIDVARFIASSLDISNQNFLAGKLLFDANPWAGEVINEGLITTPSGGSVYLIGSKVVNSGTIVTPNGETILAAGQSVSLVDTGTPGVKVEITGSEGSVTNLGTILAEAGRIGMAGVLVRNSGTLNASSVVSEGGRIFLRSSQSTYVEGDSRIIATGTKGGAVEVLGQQVTVTDKAVIDASGKQGGGTVLVGGDYRGENAAIPNATTTYFGSDAVISADAVDTGDGGKVVLWSTDSTKAYGRISARGGVSGGNGGLVETSGHKLDVDGIRVTTAAAYGKTGTWLLDPGSICIYATTSCSADLVVSWAAIDSALAGNNVKYETDGNSADLITITEGYTFNRANSLYLNSRGGISATNVTVQNSGNGAINMIAGWDGSITTYDTVYGQGSINVIGSTIKTGGTMEWKAGADIVIKGSSTRAALVQAGGNQTLKAGNQILVSGGNTISNTGATVESLSGTQQLLAKYIRLYGGGVADGATSSNLSNNFAKVTANGIQNIEITESGGELRLDAGYNITSGSGTGNVAEISQNLSSGSQNIFFYGDGAINLYGGSYGSANSAEIEGKLGVQQIGESATYHPTISLYGGKGGGLSNYGNSASISLENSSTNTQTVYAKSVSIHGGSAAYGGAGFGAPKQRFNLDKDTSTGVSLHMTGGSTQNINEDGIPGTAAYIGGKNGADISIVTTGSVDLYGGSGSPVIIGSLSGTASVSISAGTQVNIYSGATSASAGSVYIGSLSALGGSLTSALLSNDILMGSGVSLSSGQNAYIRSYRGKVGLSSGATVTGGENLSVTAASLSLNNGHLAASEGSLSATIAGDAQISNGSSVRAANNVTLTLEGTESSLHLSQASVESAASKVTAGTAGGDGKVTVNFALRKTGGIFINDVATTTTTAGASGFYNGPVANAQPALLDSTLRVNYGTAIAAAKGTESQRSTATSVITQTLNSTSSNNNLGDTSSLALTQAPPTAAPTITSTQSQAGSGSFGDGDGKDDKQETATNNAAPKASNNGQAKPKNQCS